VPAQLPQTIAYLAPVMDQLSQFDPATLGDDNPAAFALVESAVRLRIRGLDAEEATTILEIDRATLEDWLKEQGAKMFAGHFISGALLGISTWGDFDELTN
jgi:predicted DNA-binding protein (UPF0251 family)